MSATNHTSTIELSQYVSTDKPTYLTDYNGDMLKIDNAIAADRDSISTAQNKANTADGKADANKLSIDTINAQINGDPTDPSDTGLAGKVTTIDGSVNTINSLIGDGHPTTSNQTIIGAINGLEGALAPREDGDALANSYAEGEQFARGGSVYTALTALTADTAFASLTLNTDYKNSDTLVEQIADVDANKADKNSLGYQLISDNQAYTVTADGVETFKELALRCVSELRATMETDEYIELCAIRTQYHSMGDAGFTSRRLISKSGNFAINGCDFYIATAENELKFHDFYLNHDDFYVGETVFSNGSWSSTAGATVVAEVPTAGVTFTLLYRKYK